MVGKDKAKFTSPAVSVGPEAKVGFFVMGHGSETQPVFNTQKALGSSLSIAFPHKEGKRIF